MIDFALHQNFPHALVGNSYRTPRKRFELVLTGGEGASESGDFSRITEERAAPHKRAVEAPKTLLSWIGSRRFRYFLSENQRKRIEEINLELDSIGAEKSKRQLKGRPEDDLEKRQEELERQKEDLVGEIADIWSS